MSMAKVRFSDQFGALYAVVPLVLLERLKQEAAAQRRSMTAWLTEVLVARYGVELGVLPPQRVRGRKKGGAA